MPRATDAGAYSIEALDRGERYVFKIVSLPDFSPRAFSMITWAWFNETPPMG